MRHLFEDLVLDAQIETRYRKVARGRLVHRHEHASTPSSRSYVRGGCSGRKSTPGWHVSHTTHGVINGQLVLQTAGAIRNPASWWIGTTDA